MRNLHTRIAAVAVVGTLLALPGIAEARPTPWGGAGFNDLGPASGLLSVSNGRASVTNVQMIMACTDAADGQESSRAFDARFRNRVSLNRNRFAFDFTARSNGRLGHVRLSGILRSNGTGAMRARVEAVATGQRGEVVERCQGAARIPLRRGGRR